MGPATGGEPATVERPLAVRRAAREEWSREVSSLWGHSYRQTWSFGETLARRRGARSEPVFLLDGERIAGAAEVRVKPLPLVGGGFAYVSGGPLVRGTPDEAGFPAEFGRAVRALARVYVGERGCALRIAPPLGTVDRRGEVESELARSGFAIVDGPGSYRTMRLDVTRPPEELRAGLTRHWRRGLATAEKQGLAISLHEDAAAIARFDEIFGGFIVRKGFQVDLEPRFYEEVQRGLEEAERFVTQIAQKDGQVVAASVASFLGDTCVYLLGARTEAEQRSKASYLLHWNLVGMARERGLRWYDLGGIDPVANPGVHRFKAGIGAEDVTVPGPFEALPRGPRGLITRSALALHSTVRRAVRRAVRARRPPPAPPAADGGDAGGEGTEER